MSVVVHRIFPFARGLFEDKVANVWCVLDLVVKLKRRVAPALQMRLWYVYSIVSAISDLTETKLLWQPAQFRR
jgi:alpha-1,3-glucosyltransferase